MRHYEFAGKIVGKCLFESSFGGFFQQMVNGRFSRSFLAHLIGSFPQHKVTEIILLRLVFNSKGRLGYELILSE